ncbi:GTP-binding protein [Corallincola luteus]|uniref:GTP-binding protein n=1 Tax=Corallincola luteus TaxID=1775177 RepID=A0ABY2ASN2_9GAMM|nr:GTP-binding protein [Corallincola luteus]TCI05092.1 GTP-binding protein [Corallincola luteus]
MKIITQAIPTNIITGFLGVGKTTAIMKLLQDKPADERWAVLVNEFGEVGIDAALISGDPQAAQGDNGTLFIREVPGGCMCCTAGVPMQVALNQLIKQARPDRLLIEPTGLGHPKEIIAALSAVHYQDVIELQATITLVDARHLSDSKYRRHDTFIQQHQVADLIVANKSDLYLGGELEALEQFLTDLNLQHLPVKQTRQGKLALGWLAAPAKGKDPDTGTTGVGVSAAVGVATNESALSDERIELTDKDLTGLVRIDSNEDMGMLSTSWIASGSLTFDYLPLYALLTELPFERVKGVFRTSQGNVAFNVVNGVLSSCPLKQCDDSRVVVIGGNRADHDRFEKGLRGCLSQNGVLD